MTTVLSAEIINCNCPACKYQMDYYKQNLDPRSKLVAKWIGTCRTSGCDYENMTLSDANWTRIQNDETFAALYRGMERRMNAAKAAQS